MASHDMGWETFRHEFRRWMELRRMTNRQLAQRLCEAMCDENEKIDECIVKRWRHSTAPPLRALRHIAEILCMSEDPTGEGDHDPTYLLRRMGLIDQSPDSSEMFDTAFRLQALRLRLMDIRSELGDYSVRTGTGSLVQLATTLGHAAIACPVWEGPPGYPMRVADCLTLRPTVTVQDPVDAQPELRVALGANFAIPEDRRPGLDPADTDLETATDWVVPHLARPFTRAGHTVHPRARAIVVSSTTSHASPDEVGAVLARLLGYAFVSTHEVAREVTRKSVPADSLRNTIHHQFLRLPPTHHVWSHQGLRLDPSSSSTSRPDPHMSADPHLIHVRLVEDDALLGRAAREMAQGREKDGIDTLGRLRQSRDEVLRQSEATDPAEPSDARKRFITLHLTSYEDSAERWEQVMRCVLDASLELATLGITPDLDVLHDRFVHDEPDIAPSILRWLADHDCPLVDRKFAGPTPSPR